MPIWCILHRRAKNSLCTLNANVDIRQQKISRRARIIIENTNTFLTEHFYEWTFQNGRHVMPITLHIQAPIHVSFDYWQNKL